MVDTLDSKSGVSNDVPVQIRFAVPSSYKKDSFRRVFLYIYQMILLVIASSGLLGVHSQ